MGCLHLGGHKKKNMLIWTQPQNCSLNSRVLFCSRNFIPTCQNMSHTRRCINSWAACMWMNTSSVDQLRLCPANVGENYYIWRAKSWVVIPPSQWSFRSPSIKLHKIAVRSRSACLLKKKGIIGWHIKQFQKKGSPQHGEGPSPSPTSKKRKDQPDLPCDGCGMVPWIAIAPCLFIFGWMGYTQLFRKK